MKFIGYPVFDGEDYDKARENYEAKYQAYLTEEARIKEEKRRKDSIKLVELRMQKKLKELEESGIDSLENIKAVIGNNTEGYILCWAIQMRNLGFINCDKPYRLSDAVNVMFVSNDDIKEIKEYHMLYPQYNIKQTFKDKPESVKILLDTEFFCVGVSK